MWMAAFFAVGLGLLTCTTVVSTREQEDPVLEEEDPIVGDGEGPPIVEVPPPEGLPQETVLHASTTVGGVAVDRYTWNDSTGRPRSVSLKRQSGGDNGGYAVEMTYEVPQGSAFRKVTVRGDGGGENGFGYFVAHERYRSISDGSSSTIAGLHGEDDSPLGLGFPVLAARSVVGEGTGFATHTFELTYPKWGTVAAMNDPDDSVPKASSAHQKFTLPLTLQWTFQSGTDFPRIDMKLDLSAAVAGQLSFDVRGPYGVLEFADGDEDARLQNIQWGDSAFHFSTRVPVANHLTTQADWTWSEPMGNTRPYQSMVARHPGTGALYELGLIQLKLGEDTGLVYSGHSGNRGRTKTQSGNGFLSDDFADWEWPFQSANYSGVSSSGPTTGKKLAWGSSSFYGSKVDSQPLTDSLSVPLVAFPASKKLIYRTCVVVGVSPWTDAEPKGLTRRVAESSSARCALAAPLN